MKKERLSGILVHPTSFPSKFGIGDLGKESFKFIDFLEKAGQTLWQILPLGHTSFGDSPYQSFSAFAGNPLIISPEILMEKSLIDKKDIENPPRFDENNVQYGLVINYKNEILKKANIKFQEILLDSKNIALKRKYSRFCKENGYWLNDYALFISLKNYFIEDRKFEFESNEYKKYKRANKKNLGENGVNDFYYGACWNSWNEKLIYRDEKTLKEWNKKLKNEIDFYKFCQFEFFEEWIAVKKYANEKGIKIIGDIPIFVAADGVDVWSRKELFSLDEKGRPTEVAGVPPDYFSKTGQLWGNPLYKWEKHREENYEWWIQRIENMLRLVDIIRIDHFRAFESYWSIPYGAKNAVKGKWKKGPNREIFDKIEEKLGELPIIAEDLGNLNEEVMILRDELELPGMKILQFAFDNEKNEYLPHNYDTTNCVVYTGTHDNDTTLGWYESNKNDVAEKINDYARRYMNISGEDISWDLIRMAYSSIAKYAIIPIQDIMKLGSQARMNTPGISTGNWQFRYREDMLRDDMAKGLRYLSEIYNRN